MTREQQRIIRQMNKDFSAELKVRCKAHGFKKIDYMVWKIRGDLYYTLFPYLTHCENNECYISIRIQVKPLWLDDHYWDIFDMSSNKKQPLSLRAIGAFTVQGAYIYDNRIPVKEWTNEAMCDSLENALTLFDEWIEKTDEKDFLNMSHNCQWQASIRKVLILIHEEKYDEAIQYAENMESDVFISSGGGFRSYVKKYCLEKKMDNY